MILGFPNITGDLFEALLYIACRSYKNRDGLARYFYQAQDQDKTCLKNQDRRGGVGSKIYMSMWYLYKEQFSAETREGPR